MNVVSMRENIDPSYYRLLAGQKQGSLIGTFEARHPSVAERLAAGKARREKVPRTAHAAYERHADRPDPIAILEKQNATRIQKLVPVRFARMLASPFAFLRGSAAVMAGDLSNTPATGLFVNACGDMHVSNFGVFASAERNLVFAINDFDEIHPGPWEGDLKRLAASAGGGAGSTLAGAGSSTWFSVARGANLFRVVRSLRERCDTARVASEKCEM